MTAGTMWRFLVMLLTIVFALGITTPAVAAEPIARFERIGVDQGLAHPRVYAILQDHIGLIWFATGEGLNRSDGTTITRFTFDPNDPNTIADNHIRALIEDRDGILWAATAGGLSRFERATQTFTRFQHNPAEPNSLSSNDVWSMAEDSAGNLWIGTASGVINRLDRARERFSTYRPTPGTNGGTLFADHDGQIWVGTGAGLFKYVPERDAFTYVPLDQHGAAPAVYAITQSRDGSFWIGTQQGLFQLDSAGRYRARFQHTPDDSASLSDDWVFTLAEGTDGTLWVGTRNHGLNAYDPQRGRFTRYRHDPDNPTSLAHDMIHSLFVDRTGLIWIGTGRNGVSLFNPATRAFRHYGPDATQPASLPHRSVAAIHESRDGALWVGGFLDHGLARLDRATGDLTIYRHDPADRASLPANSIFVIHEDRAGTIWVGTAQDGMAALDPITGRFTRYRHDPADPGSLSDNTVYEIFEDRTGTLWVGTDNGLNALERRNGRFRRYFHDPDDPNSLGHSEISAVYEMADGSLWFGTWGGGLQRYEPATDSFTGFQHDPATSASLSDNRIFALDGDGATGLWVATMVGLNRFDPQTGATTRYTERDGLPAPSVQCVLADAEGRAWASTLRGLAQIDPANGAIERYTARDGLQSDYFAGGACSRGRSGELFFGGRDGISAFDPVAVQGSRPTPPIVLTDVTTLGGVQPAIGDVGSLKRFTLGYDASAITFGFAALEYADPQQVRYAYMLEGYDEDWVAIGNRRMATYTNLPGGDYTLRVRIAERDGTWSPAGINLALTVTTPPWRSWWAYTLYGLAAVALVAGAARSWTQERANRVLIHEVGERRRAEAEQQRLYAVAAGLREVLEVINSNRPLPDVLQFIVEQACRLLTIESGQIYRLFPPRASHPDQPGMLRVEASEGISSATVGTEIHNLHLTISYEAIRQRRPVAIADGDGVFERILAQPNLSERQRALVEEVRSRFRSILAVPLIIGDEVYGTITLYNIATRTFSDEEINLAQAFARQSALAIANARLQQQAARAALREERTRLARELHDSVTQSLYSLGLLAQSWRLAADADGNAVLSGQYGQVVDISHQTLKEMRLLINQLRLPELEQEGLIAAIQRRLEAVEGRVGMRTELIVDGEPVLPLPAIEQLYRIVQEALNNALKHAQAQAVTVRVQAQPSTRAYRIEIADDGRGFNPAAITEGYGLSGMRERAAHIGATLSVETAPGSGTRVIITGRGNNAGAPPYDRPVTPVWSPG